jgi:methionine biosynthesis protein MetW
MTNAELMAREDFREILRLVRPGARVLDVGCGEGELLELLTREKGVDGQGLEISPAGVAACLARGLAVVQGDGDRDLDHFPTRAFDYAVLSKTLQQMRDPRHALSELLRIADQAVVSVPNFGHWRVRWSLLSRGRMPETRALPDPWWSTPNIHLCTLRDFIDLCTSLDLRIDACTALSGGKPARPIDPAKGWENWRSESALFLLSKRTTDNSAAAPVDLFGEMAMAPQAKPAKRGRARA